MDYQRDSCELKRAFGSGDDETILQFVRHAPEDRVNIILMGRHAKPRSIREKVKLRFGDTGDFASSSASTGSAHGKQTLFLVAGMDNRDIVAESPGQSVSPTVESGVTSVTLQLAGGTLALDIGSMGPPMTAMRKCTTELVKTWRLDPEVQANLASLPIPKTNSLTWLDGVRLHGPPAPDGFRLIVDAAGVPSSCAPRSLPPGTPFANAVCKRLLEIARFEPAKSKTGEPTPSYAFPDLKFEIRTQVHLVSP